MSVSLILFVLIWDVDLFLHVHFVQGYRRNLQHREEGIRRYGNNIVYLRLTVCLRIVKYFQWVTLEQAKHGMVHLRLSWLNLSKNYSDLQSVNSHFKSLILYLKFDSF